MNSSLSLMEKFSAATQKKVNLVEQSPARYFVRAILATVFLTIATTIAFLVSEAVQDLLMDVVPASADSAKHIYTFTKIIFSAIFGWALVMILFMNTELFTSNAMYFSGQLFHRTVKPSKAINVLLLCYIGNFVGAVIAAAFMVYSNTFTEATGDFAHHVVMAKLAKDPITILLQGMIANLIVNIAVVLALNLKEDIAKIAAILFMVFTFAFFGSEHVIANFSAFSLVGLATNFADMQTSQILINFLFSTIGNFIGGGFFIGVVYVWLNNGSFQYKDK